ncbi:MAG TPA: transcriptional regulator FtrA [Vicinamibacterales bacterium]|nr:transcriptional regulator FtrA [Vicinamibacterales bacterium]
MSHSRNRRVTALVYDGLCLFEFGIVVEIFGLPRPELDVDWYQFQVCSLERGPLRFTGGGTMQQRAGLRALQHAGTVVIPGWRDADERPPDALLQAVRSAHRRGARLVTICSGVFVLAAAGLLDGKRATTHWRYVERLRARFPKIHVEPDVLYVDEGAILTSAGSAAGIDLCLHIVRLDYGARIANQVARRLVVPPQREGGQAQYVPAPVRAESSGGLARVLDWAQSRLDEPLSVNALARRAMMSTRTFARRFRAETGTTPHQWLTHQRLLAAQQRLETSAAPIDEIAQAVGLQTAATLRLHFRRALRTTPTAYRHKFSTRARG